MLPVGLAGLASGAVSYHPWPAEADAATVSRRVRVCVCVRVGASLLPPILRVLHLHRAGHGGVSIPPLRRRRPGAGRMRAAGQLAARRLPFCAAPPTGGDSAAPHATKKKNQLLLRPPAGRHEIDVSYHVPSRSETFKFDRSCSKDFLFFCPNVINSSKGFESGGKHL